MSLDICALLGTDEVSPILLVWLGLSTKNVKEGISDCVGAPHHRDDLQWGFSP